MAAALANLLQERKTLIEVWSRELWDRGDDGLVIVGPAVTLTTPSVFNCLYNNHRLQPLPLGSIRPMSTKYVLFTS